MEQIIQYIIAATLIALTIISILHYEGQKDIEARIEDLARQFNFYRNEDILDALKKELDERTEEKGEKE